MKKIILMHAFFALCVVYTASGQTTSIGPENTSRLMETLTAFKGDHSSMVIDLLRNEVLKNPGSHGLLVVYCGRTCKYGEIEAHLRGIALAFELKGLDPSRYSILVGGYREKTAVEFWFVPKASSYPRINAGIKASEVTYKGNYPRKLVEYDCC